MLPFLLSLIISFLGIQINIADFIAKQNSPGRSREFCAAGNRSAVLILKIADLIKVPFHGNVTGLTGTAITFTDKGF